jgi:hypothetical protein
MNSSPVQARWKRLFWLLLAFLFLLLLVFSGLTVLAHRSSTPEPVNGGGVPPQVRATTPTTTPALVGLRVVGNHFEDASGRRVVLRGASRWSLEFACRGDGHFALADFQAMRSWGMNAVRIPLNSSYWLHGDSDGDCPADYYHQTVARAVQHAEQAGLYVILVGQWSREHSNPQMAEPGDELFWEQLASIYGGDTRVGFVPVTEPHMVSWDEWANGWNGGPGMRRLVSILRAHSQNIIFVNGLSYALDLSFLNTAYAISGPNIAYELHIYQHWQSETEADPYIGRYAVVAGEFGLNDCCHDYVSEVMSYFEQHQTGYFAWAWAEGAHRALLMPDGWDGTPSQLGDRVRRFMLAHGNATFL